MESGTYLQLIMKLSIVVIYHPPYTNKNPITNNMLIDDFTDWLVEEIMLHDNLVILGNFNLHINDLDNPDTGIFLDTVTAMGLNQPCELCHTSAG